MPYTTPNPQPTLVNSENLASAIAAGAVLPNWTASKSYAVNDVVRATATGTDAGSSSIDIGDLIRRESAGTARSSFDTTEAALWRVIGADIVRSVAGKSGAVSLVKGDVGLDSVDNTQDSAKPVSTAQQTALDGKAPTTHTHAQADVTNLSTDLAAKQATLVNQTNLKSVNGNSLLGSGDLPVSAQGVTVSDKVAHLENFTANTNGSYTVSASSEFSSGYQAHEAFDSDAASDWATQGVTSNFWIKIQLPTSRAIHRFVAKGRGSAEHMTNWRFEGSNDNTNWTTLDSAAVTIDKTTGVDRTFTNTTKYLYYRLFAISGSGTNPGLSELRLFGKEYSLDNFVV